MAIAFTDPTNKLDFLAVSNFWMNKIRSGYFAEAEQDCFKKLSYNPKRTHPMELGEWSYTCSE